jgi:hypothetical protein
MTLKPTSPSNWQCKSMLWVDNVPTYCVLPRYHEGKHKNYAGIEFTFDGQNYRSPTPKVEEKP